MKGQQLTYRANTTTAYESAASRSAVLARQALAANELTTRAISNVLGTSRVTKGVDRKGD